MKIINKILILIGVILMVLGILNFLIPGKILTASVVNYFHLASSFFLLAIASKLICTKE